MKTGTHPLQLVVDKGLENTGHKQGDSRDQEKSADDSGREHATGAFPHGAGVIKLRLTNRFLCESSWTCV